MFFRQIIPFLVAFNIVLNAASASPRPAIYLVQADSGKNTSVNGARSTTESKHESDIACITIKAAGYGLNAEEIEIKSTDWPAAGDNQTREVIELTGDGKIKLELTFKKAGKEDQHTDSPDILTAKDIEEFDDNEQIRTELGLNGKMREDVLQNRSIRIDRLKEYQLLQNIGEDRLKEYDLKILQKSVETLIKKEDPKKQSPYILEIRPPNRESGSGYFRIKLTTGVDLDSSGLTPRVLQDGKIVPSLHKLKTEEQGNGKIKVKFEIALFKVKGPAVYYTYDPQGGDPFILNDPEDMKWNSWDFLFDPDYTNESTAQNVIESQLKDDGDRAEWFPDVKKQTATDGYKYSQSPLQSMNVKPAVDNSRLIDALDLDMRNATLPIGEVPKEEYSPDMRRSGDFRGLGKATKEGKERGDEIATRQGNKISDGTKQEVQKALGQYENYLRVRNASLAIPASASVSPATPDTLSSPRRSS